ncbi:MAG: NADH-quinone oxidoreductase subunit C [Anaerolineales bacterium]|uniref:hydrogenase large subunit n=1 Tax=Candidatus Villigracilis vicinus TaxID=3140679 RepID=UPI0031360027|nr:NADH-quinone oxidoreductase subunit C [Anaerolineales bacterium]
MTTEAALQRAKEILAPFSKGDTTPEANRLDVNIEATDLPAATAALIRSEWGYLSAITPTDLGREVNKLELIYHFCEGAAITSLRIHLPREDQPDVPSISDQIPVASFFERELGEMLGVHVVGTPDPSRLFLPDDWPDGVYPLREDFSIEKAAPVEPRETFPEMGRIGNKFTIPIGPQHPALKEPGHFEFAVDGEIITGARMRLGYVHRGIEKATEQRNWIQNLYLLERICGICSHTHTSAYAMGVEKLAQVEVPARAQAIREIIAGLERIHSHLLWLGVSAHEAGFDTLFMYSWRDRETVMDLLEKLTGNRVNYSIIVLGGVKHDLDAELSRSIHTALDYLEERIRYYLHIVTTDTSFLQRTRGIGTMTLEEAKHFGALGPTARASGLKRDVRIDSPYGAYRYFPISLTTDDRGDLEARFAVRMKELLVSCVTIRIIVDNLPAGEITTRFPRKIPAGETISRVEAPRGEAFYYIKSNGGENPARIKIRTPSICNWTSVLNKAVGHQLADIPMLIAGMDPCFSCNDRMVTVRKQDSSQTLTWSQLREYGIQKYSTQRETK